MTWFGMTRESVAGRAARREEEPPAPRPTYHSGWVLGRLVAVHLFTHARLLFQRGKYPHFRLRALLAHPRKGMIDTLRVIRFGKHHYPASLRTPRWPSAAFDRMIVNGGMNVAPDLVRHKHHLDIVILSITRRCGLRCTHCYDAFNRADTDIVPVETWIEVVRRLEDLGTSVIVLSGGEPMLRYDDLLTILDRSDPDRSDIHMHSSGAGVTPLRARELARRGLVAAGIGLDFPDAARHDRFRGAAGAFRDAVNALVSFADAGVFTYTNLCLTREIVRDGSLHRYLDLARELRVGVVQLLEPKPCGRYASRRADVLFRDEDRSQALAFFREVNRDRRYAGHPPVAYNAHFERQEDVGCLMGGRGHFAVNGNGDVLPCIFLPVSFGNILREDIDAILERMRSAHPKPLYGECPAVARVADLAERQPGG
jgi:MoaA/NifB/PqqE/SkfB family radical SAM enzyme